MLAPPLSYLREPEAGRGAGPAKEKSLRVGAAGCAHEKQLIFCFDALGDGADLQASPEPGHSGYDRGAAVVFR